LAFAGVKRIYGIVGDSLNGITDAVRRQGKIEWVHVRHEEVAAFAAGAGADLGGEVAAWARSRGPGPARLPPVARAGARHCGANSLSRDRRRLFPGNPPANVVQRVQSLLRADLRG